MNIEKGVVQDKGGTARATVMCSSGIEDTEVCGLCGTRERELLEVSCIRVWVEGMCGQWFSLFI